MFKKLKGIVIFLGLLVGFYSAVRPLKSYFGLEGFESNTIRQQFEQKWLAFPLDVFTTSP
ncbi:hypothetical protein BpHYR1_046526 [Brachionus plicatilis]|uniref:Uncharacterized protein n=1 Tax=Brachionus plicatilis TaxID=10195 RepID=A0A3M7QUI3_BRAPC|nr:hypothetical protein BpHYR1_046526 [Brachionus plicatilis]